MRGDDFVRYMTSVVRIWLMVRPLKSTVWGDCWAIGGTGVRGIKFFWEVSCITETSLKGNSQSLPYPWLPDTPVVAPFHTHSRHDRSTIANTARACTTFLQS